MMRKTAARKGPVPPPGGEGRKRMRSILAAILAMAVILSGCGSREPLTDDEPVEFEAQTWTLVTSGGEGTAERQAAETFAGLLFDRTHGTVKAECVSLRDLEGDYESPVDALRAGAADIAWATAAEFAAVDERLDAAGLPFLFLSREEAEAAMDGDGGAALGEILRQNGFQCLGIGTEGFRCLTSSETAIEGLESLRGLRVRTGGGDVVEKSFAAWGAETVDAPWPGVYTALETGIYDAQEELLPTICDASLQKVQKYLCQWPAFYSAAYLCMDGALYDSLAELLAGIARDCGAEAAAVQRQASLAQDEEDITAWKAVRGNRVTSLSEEALAEFREASRPVWDAFSDRYGGELVTCLSGGED